MEKTYFVMLRSQSGETLLPMMDGENLAMFATGPEAKRAAEKNPLGEACGAIVFDADFDGSEV